MHRIQHLLALFVALIFAGSLAAQTTWTGAVSSSWSVGGNWTAGVPTAATAVTIAAAANAPSTIGVAGAACGALTIQNGVTLTASAAFPLLASGNVSCAGTMVGELRVLASATIATSGSGALDAVVLQSGAHSITAATVGSLLQLVGAGALTVQTLRTLGNFELHGAGMVGLPGSSIDCGQSMSILCNAPVTTPPATMLVHAAWNSDASWQPTSGKVIFTGDANTVAFAPGTVWFDVEAEANFGTAWQGDMRVAGTLRMRGDIIVQGTVIDLTQRAFMTLDALLTSASVTTFRVRNGLTGAGVIDLPTATMDADGDLTFFVSARLNLNSGVHHISNSLGMPGIMTTQPGASIVFDGAGVITVALSSVLPDVNITGTYTLRTAHIGGNLLHAVGAGALGVGNVTVDGSCTFAGATVTDFSSGLLDANGNVAWQTPGVVTAPPATIQCAGSWTSNGNFQPASGLVVFDGIGAKTVTTPAFVWRSLRVASSTSITTTLPVVCNGFLDVQGQLSTAGNDVEVFGATTVSGTLSANASLRVRAHAGLVVGGSLQATAARLDVDGPATVPGTVALGAGVHQISGSVTVTGALTIPAGQLLNFDGSGTIDIVASNPIPNVDFVAGNYDVQSLVVGQDLHHASGVLAVHSCVVQRDAVFVGNGLANLANGLLNVRRNLTLQLSASVPTPPDTIRCGGNWVSSASFQPSSGLVVYDGAGAQSVTAGPAPWFDVRIAAGSATTLPQNLAVGGFADVRGTFTVTGTSLAVTGDLTVAGTGSLTAATATSITANAGVTVDGLLTAGAAALAAVADVVVGPSGALALGVGPHSFQAGLDVQGSISVPPTGDFHFDGAGTISVAAPNVLPTVRFGGSNNKSIQLTVQGTIRHVGGTLNVVSLVGLGNAQFQGLTVVGSGTDLLDVAGDILFGTTGVVVTPPGTIRCGGQWTSNPQFLPTSGQVEMVGVGARTMTSNQLFLASLLAGPGCQLTFSGADVILQRDLTVQGTVTAPNNLLEVRRNLQVAGTGVLNLTPTSVSSVAGSVANAGAIAGSGSIRMVGVGTVSGAGVYGKMEIAAAGEIAVAGSVTLGGLLTLTSGALRVPAGATLTVNGDLMSLGATLRGAVGGVLDVNGQADVTGLTADPAGVPDIRCSGDWTADATFAPTVATVFLDGTGAIIASGNLTFAHLDVSAGTRSLATAVTAVALDVVVGAGATLAIGPQTLQLTAATVAVAGEVGIGANGTWFLGPLTAVTVQPSGKLTMIGLFQALARVDGPVGGGYSFVVDGAVEAVNFGFAHMGPGGIRINAGATVAAAPRDLRGGVFSGGDPAPGACLLHLDRSAPTQLRYARFEDAGTVAFNIRSTGTAAIGVVNDEGTFTGVAHEDDPGTVIDWLPPEHTAVASFTSRAAVHRTEIAATTTAEFDVLRFHLLRALSPAGPFADIAGSPVAPLGGPVLGASYAATDFATTDTTLYYYRLEEVLTHGARRTLGDDFARPWPQQLGGVWFVGTNGGYPDIAAAVAAAAPGGAIVVQAGTYPAFTINKAVKIFPDGSGPVILDTTLAAFVVRDIPVGAPDLDLHDLRIGSPTSPFGMQVVNCDNTIVLDRLTVAAGSGVVGLLVDDTPHIAVQHCTISGDPGLRYDNASLSYLSRGSVDELVLAGASTVTRCDVVPGSQTVGVGSTVTVRPGVMPDFGAPAAWVGDKVVPIDISAAPGSLYALFYSFGRDFLDLADVFPFIDMVLLIEQTQAQILFSGVTPAGTDARVLPAPGNPALWGLGAQLQIFELKSSGLGRMSNSRDIVLLP